MCKFQCILEDIKKNKVHAESLLYEYDMQLSEEYHFDLSDGHSLIQEISYIENLASVQCMELREAFDEQEQYEKEIFDLNGAISEVKQQLITSPSRVSSVDALKQQISNHNVRFYVQFVLMYECSVVLFHAFLLIQVYFLCIYILF